MREQHPPRAPTPGGQSQVAVGHHLGHEEALNTGEPRCWASVTDLRHHLSRVRLLLLRLFLLLLLLLLRWFRPAGLSSAPRGGPGQVTLRVTFMPTLLLLLLEL